MEEAADPVHEVVRLPEARHVLLLARVHDALGVGLDALPAVRADRERAAFRHASKVATALVGLGAYEGKERIAPGPLSPDDASTGYHVRDYQERHALFVLSL